MWRCAWHFIRYLRSKGSEEVFLPPANNHWAKGGIDDGLWVGHLVLLPSPITTIPESIGASKGKAYISLSPQSLTWSDLLEACSTVPVFWNHNNKAWVFQPSDPSPLSSFLLFLASSSVRAAALDGILSGLGWIHQHKESWVIWILQGSTKRRVLGCVILVSWLPLAAGCDFTQPRAFLLVKPCTPSISRFRK